MRKSKIKEQEKSNCYILLIPVLCSVLMLAHLVSSFFPTARLWGLNHLAYFPVETRILLTVIFLLFLLPKTNSKIQNLLKTPSDVIYRVTKGRAKKSWFVIFALASFPLFWILRTRTHFLGDSYQVISNLEKGDFFVKWAELGEVLSRIYLYKLLNPILDIDGATLYELSSCLLGVIFVFLVLLLADFLGRSKWEKLFLFLLIASMGSIQLFCGYAEHYSLSYMLMFAFVFFSVKYLKGEGKPFLPLLFFALAAFSHISAFYLLPSVFVLYLVGYQKGKKSSFFEKMEVWAFLYLTVIAVLIFLHMKRYSWTVGMSRDWDLFSSTAIGYTILAGYLFLKVAGKRIDFKYVSSILLITAALCTLPWVMLNTSEDKAIERFRNLLELDPKKSRNGHYALAIYFGKEGLFDQMEKENQAQVIKFPAISSVKQGFEFLDANQMDKAFEACQKTLDMDPDLADAHRLLGKIHDSREAWDSAEVEFKTAIGLKPGDPQMYADLGTHYLIIGRLDTALDYYRKALILGTKDAVVYNNVGSIYSDYNKWIEAIRAYRRALEIDPGYAHSHYGLGIIFLNQGKIDQAISEFEKASEIKPDFAYAHYNLAYLYAQKGKREEAERELKFFSDYVSDTKEVEKLKEQIEFLLKK